MEKKKEEGPSPSSDKSSTNLRISLRIVLIAASLLSCTTTKTVLVKEPSPPPKVYVRSCPINDPPIEPSYLCSENAICEYRYIDLARKADYMEVLKSWSKGVILMCKTPTENAFANSPERQGGTR